MGALEWTLKVADISMYCSASYPTYRNRFRCWIYIQKAWERSPKITSLTDDRCLCITVRQTRMLQLLTAIVTSMRLPKASFKSFAFPRASWEKEVCKKIYNLHIANFWEQESLFSMQKIWERVKAWSFSSLMSRISV